MKERGKGCQLPKGPRGEKLASVVPGQRGGPPHAEGYLLKLNPPTCLDPVQLCVVLKKLQEPVENWV